MSSPDISPDTAHDTGHRLAYDDATSVQQMSADCQAASRNLHLDHRLERVARAATAPAPSIRYADFPRDLAKRDLSVSEAAQRIANALHLHLD